MNFCFLARHVAPQHKAYFSRVDLAMRLSLGRQAVSRSEVCEGWEWPLMPWEGLSWEDRAK